MMAQLTLDVPDIWVQLPRQEREALIRAGLYQATQALIRRLKNEIAEGQEHLQRFEARYGVPFARFETEILPTLDTLEAHDVYNDWFFWRGVLTEKERLLAQLQRFEIN